MKTAQNKYLTLFLSTFQLSAFTFGGGFVIIPLMRKKFVEQLHWIDEQEMLDLTAIAQSSPGAIAVNASILVGYRVAGVPGALLTVLGTVLPPLIIISMNGMLAGVAAVICDVVIPMASSLIRFKRVLPILVLVLSFVAVRFFDANIILVILVCGCIGALDTYWREKARKERG